MIYFNKDEEIFEVEENKGLFNTGYQLHWLWPGPHAKFNGVDMGGKMTAVVGGFDDGPAIIKVAGHTGWSSRGVTEYYPPQYLVGIVSGIDDHGNGGTFKQDFVVRYTRMYANDAKGKAMELYYQLRNKKK